MTLPRVLLADDHTLVLEGFRRLLDDQCELVGTVGDGRALLEAIPELKPDIVILDISMPVLNGIDAARVLNVKFPQVKVVFITMHADPAYVRAAFEAGASAYLLKRCVGEELGQAIRAVRSGNFYVTPLVTKDVVESMSISNPSFRKKCRTFSGFGGYILTGAGLIGSNLKCNTR